MQGLATSTTTGGWRACLAAAGLMLLPLAGAEANNSRLAHLNEMGSTTPPIGWVQFCREFAADCAMRPARIDAVRLDRSSWNLMAAINSRVNAAVEPVTDIEQYGVEEHWTYPVSGRGDCEDYVLEKKKQMIAAGFPASALLITVVRDRRGDGHAVLTVRTDRGDFILDNETDAIRLWNQTGYRFVKRQSEADPNRWVTIGPASAPAAVASQ